MKRKIGWQKYEASLEEQMSSSIVNEIIKTALSYNSLDSDNAENEDVEYEEEAIENETNIIPLSSKLIEEAMMLSNFDCWIGHTNFNITEEVKQTLDNAEGVEIMKIMSRYRFFIGVGKMFTFQNVRKEIEDKLLTE